MQKCTAETDDEAVMQKRTAETYEGDHIYDVISERGSEDQVSDEMFDSGARPTTT